MADAADEGDLVLLEAHARASPVAEAASGELALDLLDPDGQAGGEPLDDHDEGGPVLALSTTPATTGTWPDGGAKVEVWLQRPTAEPIASLEGLHPSAHLVELEVLGPLETLQPGDASTLEIEWRVGPA